MIHKSARMESLYRLIDLGVWPILRYTRTPEGADEWRCSDGAPGADAMMHAHGVAPLEAIRGLLKLVEYEKAKGKGGSPMPG